MKTPIVEYISPEEGKEQYSERDLANIGLKNVVNNSSSDKSDIIIAQPRILQYIIKQKAKSNPFDLNPSVIVFDEFDELFTDAAAESVLFIMRHFSKRGVIKKAQRQFIFSGSTIPNYIFEQPIIEFFKASFGGFEHIRDPKLHSVSPLIDFQTMRLDGQEDPLELLVNTIRKEVKSNTSEQGNIIVYVETKKLIEAICDKLYQEDIPNMPFFSNELTVQ